MARPKSPNPMTSTINVRVTPVERVRIEAVMHAEGQGDRGLSEFVRGVLTRYVEHRAGDAGHQDEAVRIAGTEAEFEFYKDPANQEPAGPPVRRGDAGHQDETYDPDACIPTTGHFVDGDEEGYGIFCANDTHSDRVCPCERDIVREPKGQLDARTRAAHPEYFDPDYDGPRPPVRSYQDLVGDEEISVASEVSSQYATEDEQLEPVREWLRGQGVATCPACMGARVLRDPSRVCLLCRGLGRVPDA